MNSYELDRISYLEKKQQQSGRILFGIAVVFIVTMIIGIIASSSFQ